METQLSLHTAVKHTALSDLTGWITAIEGEKLTVTWCYLGKTWSVKYYRDGKLHPDFRHASIMPLTAE